VTGAIDETVTAAGYAAIFKKDWAREEPMEPKDFLVALVIIALSIVVVILFIRSSTNASRADKAATMGASLMGYLQDHGYMTLFASCRAASSTQFDKLTACLEDIRTNSDYTKYFKLSRYQNADARKNTTGYLIIENAEGMKTFGSANFTLVINNEPVTKGCTVPGEITPGYTCRFDLTQPCVAGDNLEITYDGKRVFLKTC